MIISLRIFDLVRFYLLKLFKGLVWQQWMIAILLHYLTIQELIHHEFVVFFYGGLFRYNWLRPGWLTCEDIFLVTFVIVFLKVFKVWNWRCWLAWVILRVPVILMLLWIVRLVKNVAVNDQTIIGVVGYRRFVDLIAKRWIRFDFLLEVGHDGTVLWIKIIVIK